MNSLEQYREKKIEICEKGLKKKQYIFPHTLDMYLTNQCNANCLMCPFISKETKYRTYFGKAPIMVDLKEFKKMLGSNTTPRIGGGVKSIIRNI